MRPAFEEYLIEENTKRRENEFFIDRRGKIHRYKGELNEEILSMHTEIARGLLPGNKRPQDVLMDLGWVMIGSVVYSHPIVHQPLSQSQINKLEELGKLKWLHALYQEHYIKYEDYCLKTKTE